MRTHTKRLQAPRKRGAVLVEAICVISVFILFFVAMVYFESLYHHRLRAGQLARAGAVAQAMDACPDGAGALEPFRGDLGDLTGDSPQGSATTDPSTVASIPPPGKAIGSGGDPLGNAVSSEGFSLFQTTAVSIHAHATAGAPNTARFGATMEARSFMACGDKQSDGKASAVWDFVRDAFSSSMHNK